MAKASSFGWLVVLAAGCATIGSPGEGDVDLPSAGVGPFRKLTGAEVLGIAPFVVDDRLSQYREPAALALGSGEGVRSSSVALYFVAGRGAAGSRERHDVIVRSRADDARSFYGAALDLGHSPKEVLAASAPWEGQDLSGPSALRVSDEIFLYYAARGGIGVARSVDGFSFRKEPGPILGVDDGASREGSPPRAPSVAIFPDGQFHMLYVSGIFIFEASSADGIHWTRLGTEPVLGPSPPRAPGSFLPGERPPFDTGRVADPLLLPWVTPSGRLHVRVLYTGYDGVPAAPGISSAIGFAARFATTGPLVRNVLPVFAVDKHEAAPALFSWDGGAMLYVEQDKPGDGASIYRAISAAYAPATGTLSQPESYAEAP